MPRERRHRLPLGGDERRGVGLGEGGSRGKSQQADKKAEANLMCKLLWFAKCMHGFAGAVQYR